MGLRIIGDIHAKLDQYIRIANGANGPTLCVGDVGFDYSTINGKLNPVTHRIIGGNHDNYDNLSEHFLEDFGPFYINNFGTFFYIRGAFSIDKQYRTVGVSWWDQEEMSMSRLQEAIDEYVDIKPELVISHTIPDCVKAKFLPAGWKAFNSRTETAMQKMFEIHSPKIWIFGHFHWDKAIIHKGTIFRCLDELSFVDMRHPKDYLGLLQNADL